MLGISEYQFSEEVKKYKIEEYFENEPAITFFETAEFPMYSSVDLWIQQKNHMVKEIKG